MTSEDPLLAAVENLSHWHREHEKHYAAAPLALRFIKVETTSSASWVAWREIQVFAPGG